MDSPPQTALSSSLESTVSTADGADLASRMSLAEIKAQNKVLTKKLASLEAQLEQIKATKQTLVVKTNQVMEILASTRSERDTFMKKTLELESQNALRDASHEEDLRKAGDERERLNQRIAFLEHQLESTRNLLTVCMGGADNSRIVEENIALKNKIQDIERASATPSPDPLTEATSTMAPQGKHAVVLAQRVKSLESQLTEVKDRKQALQTELKQASARLGMLQIVHSQETDLSGFIDDKGKKKQQLESESLSMRVVALENLIASLEGERSALAKSVTTYLGEKESLLQSIKDLQLRLIEEKTTCSTAVRERDSSVVRIARLETDLGLSLAETSGLRAEKERVMADLSMTRTDLNSECAALANLNTMHNQVLTERNDLLRRVRELEVARARDEINMFDLARMNGTTAARDADQWQRIMKHARYLGMDPVFDANLLWIAEESLDAVLPEGWTECFDESGNVYYWNEKTDQSIWEQPMDDYYRFLYVTLKRKFQETAAQTAGARPGQGQAQSTAYAPHMYPQGQSSRGHAPSGAPPDKGLRRSPSRLDQALAPQQHVFAQRSMVA